MIEQKLKKIERPIPPKTSVLGVADGYPSDFSGNVVGCQNFLNHDHTVRFNKFGEKVRIFRHKTKNAKEKNGQFRSMRILRRELKITSI